MILMPRICGGCGFPLPADARANQRHHSGACRQRAHKAGKASPKRHRPSGERLPYLTTVNVVAELVEDLLGYEADAARAIAEDRLRPALSKGARDRIDERQAA